MALIALILMAGIIYAIAEPVFAFAAAHPIAAVLIFLFLLIGISDQ